MDEREPDQRNDVFEMFFYLSLYDFCVWEKKRKKRHLHDLEVICGLFTVSVFSEVYLSLNAAAATSPDVTAVHRCMNLLLQ